MTTLGAGPAHDVLQRASGVQLIGEMAGSGYRVPPSLVRRSDGQTIQLTPLLYATLHEIDGRRTAAEVAEAVSSSSGRTVSEENVRHLVDEQLRPLGLLTMADGAEPTVRKQNPLLGLRFRYAVTDPERTRRLTAPFQFLFRPWMVVPLMAAFLAVCWWVFFEKGLASATYEAFQHPGLLILVFAVTILSAGFHEFGHAAAARYGGSTPGVMGFGMYLVWPAFYTDVTDSYRLGRGGRVRTDLGGLYFNAIVAVAITGVWWATSYDALLLVVATQILQMIRQLQPLVRFDGYHVLADVTGVPDLFHRIKPTLLGALPWRWGDPEARLLKPWARVVVTTWVVVVVPLLLASLVLMVFALPRVMGTAWASLVKQQDVLAGAWADGDLLQATARVLAMVAITIPMAGSVYMLVRLVRKSALGTWRATAGKPVKRVLAGIAAGAMIGGVAYAWWPHDGAYRPIQPTERGTVGDAVLMTGLPQMVGYAPRPAVVPYFVEGQQGVMQAVWDTTEPMPTKASPQLALVLVPKDQGDDRRPVLRPHGHPGHHLDPGLGGRGRPRHRRCRRTQHHHHDDRGPGLGVPVREAAGAGARGQPGARGEHHRRHDGVRSGVRPGVGDRRGRDERQRGAGLRLVHQLRRGGGGVPGGVRARHRRDRRQRGGAAEPRRCAQLQLRELPDLRPRAAAVRDAARSALRGGDGRPRRAVGADRVVRRRDRRR